MKNKNLLVALSKLLKLDEKVVVESSEKEDGDDSIIKDWLTKHNPYTLEEIGKLTENAGKQALEKADFEINDVPKAMYSKIKGAAFEKFEKDFAKKAGVEKWDSLEDLITKASEKNNTGKGSQDEALLNQITTLKNTVKELEEAKETLVKETESKFETEFITRDFDSALSSIPLDYEDDENKTLTKQRNLMKSAFNSEFKLQRKNNKTVVADAEGKLITDKVGDPKPVNDVLSEFANGYGFKIKQPDTGGRGSSSSSATTNTYKGKSFEEVAKAKGVKPNTDESDALYKEWIAENN